MFAPDTISSSFKLPTKAWSDLRTSIAYNKNKPTQNIPFLPSLPKRNHLHLTILRIFKSDNRIYRFIIISMAQKLQTCYQECNSKFSAMSPSRLFCKKGCDSDEEKIAACKDETCNKLCIKSNQGQQKLWFQFLVRAPEKPDVCLEACIYGCNRNRSYLE